MADQTSAPKVDPTEESTEFYEAMPMTAGHFVFRDDTIDDVEAEHVSIEHEIRTTAIITLVLVAVVAVALGVLVWKGISTIKGTSASLTSSTAAEL